MTDKWLKVMTENWAYGSRDNYKQRMAACREQSTHIMW